MVLARCPRPTFLGSEPTEGSGELTRPQGRAPEAATCTAHRAEEGASPGRAAIRGARHGPGSGRVSAWPEPVEPWAAARLIPSVR